MLLTTMHLKIMDVLASEHCKKIQISPTLALHASNTFGCKELNLLRRNQYRYLNSTGRFSNPGAAFGVHYFLSEVIQKLKRAVRHHIPPPRRHRTFLYINKKISMGINKYTTNTLHPLNQTPSRNDGPLLSKVVEQWSEYQNYHYLYAVRLVLLAVLDHRHTGVGPKIISSQLLSTQDSRFKMNL